MTSPLLDRTRLLLYGAPLASSTRSRSVLWRSTRQPQSAWQAPVPWAANRLTRATSNASPSVRPQRASNSAQLLSRIRASHIDMRIAISARPAPHPGDVASHLSLSPWSGQSQRCVSHPDPYACNAGRCVYHGADNRSQVPAAASQITCSAVRACGAQRLRPSVVAPPTTRARKLLKFVAPPSHPPPAYH